MKKKQRKKLVLSKVTIASAELRQVAGGDKPQPPQGYRSEITCYTQCGFTCAVC